MQIALINDTHFGVRSESPELLAHQTKFYDEQFFPYLQRHNIQTVVHLGDIVDRRKFIQYPILDALKNVFVRKLYEQGIDTHILVGNHDTYFRNTNSLHAMESIFGRFDGAWSPIFYAGPDTITLGGRKILMLPWITTDNQEASFYAIEHTPAEIIFGHLELAGFEMYKGLPNYHGLTPKTFERFKAVYSGHFHHKSDVGNIHYLGAPYEMTWSDYDDPRGFHILETDTLQLTHIQNTDRMFIKLFYADVTVPEEDLLATDFDACAGKYVKVVVREKSNPFTFDQYMQKLTDVGCADITVVEDHHNCQRINESDLIDGAADTLTVLCQYVNSLEGTVDKPAIETLLRNLYQEALDNEEAD